MDNDRQYFQLSYSRSAKQAYCSTRDRECWICINMVPIGNYMGSYRTWEYMHIFTTETVGPWLIHAYLLN
jgi:hypothetical protein